MNNLKRPPGLRTREATRSLIERNALSCSEAQWPACKCQCQGALHGKPHSPEWIEETTEQVYEQSFRYVKPEYRQFYEEG